MNRFTFPLTLLLALLFSSVSFGSTPPYTDDDRKLHISKTFGKLPLRFEKNEGQTDKQVRFISRGNGYSMYLTPTEAVMVLSKTTGGNKKFDPMNPESLMNTREDIKTESSVIRMKLIGSNPDPKIYGQEKQVTKSNYLIGNDKSKWRTGVTNFGKVRYEEVYPGIDLVFYGNQRKLEYDFVVEPDADPKVINFEFDGEESITVDWDGNLRLETKVGEIVEKAPIIYQEEDGQRKLVEGKYVLAENKVSFKLDEYDDEKELVIDPVLEFSTYLGGTDREFTRIKVDVDSVGNVYVVGATASIDFPALNAFQSSYGGDVSDAFVTKFDPSGSLVFSTYLGGDGEDWTVGIGIDNTGNLYLSGETSSSNFPTLNAFQNSLAGIQDFFVTKFDPSGLLVFSTYLGGDSAGNMSDMEVDGTGNVYLTGKTAENNFPTLNAIQSSPGGSFDVFVTKFDPSGALVFSTYLGGTSADGHFSGFHQMISVDSSGNIFVTGTTLSSDFPTLNAFQSSYGGGGIVFGDVFVAKFDPSGLLVFSTYLGGEDVEEVMGIDVDSVGNVHVAGETFSSNFPTLNAFQSSFVGGTGDSDTFVVKFDPSGSLVFSTYLGGSLTDSPLGIDVDNMGNVYVVGDTFSSNFPTLNAFQSSSGGGGDAFVTKFNSIGTLIYSTYFGGFNLDQVKGFAVNSFGNVYVAGNTHSSNSSPPRGFPTLNAFQSFYGGIGDVFVTKFKSSGFLAFSTYLGGSSGDQAEDIKFDSVGNVYVAGETFSSNFPTLNAFQNSFEGGPGDNFVSKIFENTIIPILNNFDGFKKSDVLLEHSSGILVSALLSNSIPINFGFLLQAAPAEGWTVNSTGDFNGDNKSDLLLYKTTTGNYRTILLDGTTVLNDQLVFTIDPSIGVEPRGVGDFDGDGEDEIIIYHPPSGFTALVYLVGGAFSSFEAITNIDVANNWTLKDTGHFNGDNKTDLLITNTVTGESAVIEMDGSVATNPTPIFTLDPATGWTIKETGDFTGNGKTDILILHTAGALGVLVMDGLVFQSLYVPGGLLPDWELVNVGQYDSDNKADFLIYDTVTGDLMTAVQDGTIVTIYTVVLNLGPASGWSYHSGKP